MMELFYELVNEVLTDETKVLIFVFLGIFMLEMFSGTVGAIMQHEFDSTVFRMGLYGKSGYFMLLIFAFLLSMMVKMPYLFHCVILWISASEGTSVIENLHTKMGIPIPDFIKNVLVKTKETTEDTIEENNK